MLRRNLADVFLADVQQADQWQSDRIPQSMSSYQRDLAPDMPLKIGLIGRTGRRIVVNV